MKYTGPNVLDFERDVRALLDWGTWHNHVGATYEAAVHKLAADYGIGGSEIWDILPEYEEVPR